MLEKITQLVAGKTALQNRAKLKLVLNVVIRILDALDGEQDWEPKKK